MGNGIYKIVKESATITTKIVLVIGFLILAWLAICFIIGFYKGFMSVF